MTRDPRGPRQRAAELVLVYNLAGTFACAIEKNLALHGSLSLSPLGERVARSGALFSRFGTAEGVRRVIVPAKNRRLKRCLCWHNTFRVAPTALRRN